MREFHRKYISKINFIEIENLWDSGRYQWEWQNDNP